MDPKYIVFGFVLFLMLPLVGQLTGLSKRWFPNKEKRLLVAFPEFTGDSLKAYPAKFDAWYGDNFGFRNGFFGLYSAAKYYGLKVSPLPEKVMVGKSGWLYGEPENIRKFSNSYDKRLDPLIEGIGKDLERQSAWLKNQGIYFYLAIAPAKYTVCKTYLPDELAQKSWKTKTDQFVTLLKKVKRIRLIDLSMGFQNMEMGCRCFRKTDAHWNEYGAFIASNLILKRVKQDFPGLDVLSPTHYKLDSLSIFNGGYATLLNIPIREKLLIYKLTAKNKVSPINPTLEVPKGYRFNEPYEHRFVKEQKSPKGLKALFIHDSMMLPMMQYLNQSFAESVFLRKDNKTNDWWDKGLIQDEKPDVLILELSETDFQVLTNPRLNPWRQ